MLIPAAAAPRVALLSVLLYAAALMAAVFPATRGATLLLHGWLGVLRFHGADPRVAFAWLANPLLLAAWSCMCLSAWRAAAACAVPATALAIAVSFGRRILVSASGTQQPLPHLGPGYWLWLAALGAALLAALLGSSVRHASAGRGTI